MDIKIAPSILSADFVRLADEVEEIKAGGADYVHVDVMDGLFVPNISIGIPVVQSLRKATDMFLDVHLMIDRPHRYVGRFCDAGADLVCFHVEADEPQDILAALDEIKSKGKLAALAIKPRTPASVVLPYLDKLDMVLVMTVEPGFGGQSFMSDMLPKIRGIRALIEQYCPGRDVEVDGGIDEKTAPLVVDAGANVLVAGSAVFGKSDRAAAIAGIDKFAMLPGIGKKSAQRLAFFTLSLPDAEAEAFAAAITEAKRSVRCCSVCQNLTDAEICPICSSSKRDQSVICVVAEPRDVLSIERGREYNGVYHVLHGVLSPLSHVGPDDLKISELVSRVAAGGVEEVIMALNPDTEGETTAMYISRLLKPFGVKVTRLAYGIPVGSNLEFADDATLQRALEGRVEM